MKKKTLYLAALSLLLAGCGHTGSSTPVSNPSTPESDTIISNNPVSNTSSTKPSEVKPDSSVTPDSTINSSSTPDSTSSSSAPVADLYKIILAKDSRYDLYSDKDEAKKGDKVTIEVDVKDGFELKSVLVDSSAISANAQGKYVFVMPAHDVRISAQLAIDGDVTIQGDISAQLTEEVAGSGLFVARGIVVNNDSTFAYSIKKDDNDPMILGVTSFDRTKCFANIGLGNGTGNNRVKLSGGCTYDFYYDANAALPCYVRRTSINTLPSNAQQFEALMGGNSRVMSSGAMNVQGVNHVSYQNTLANEQYTWDLYNDDSSLATVQDLTTKSETAVVYKKIDGDIYSVVDSYTESNKQNSDNDPTKNGDSFAFSGKYKLGDSDDKGKETNKIDIDYQREYMNENLAKFDVKSPSHGMQSLDFEIMYAYRVGMTVQDEITQASVDVSSVDNGDNTFTTTIHSSSTYDETAAAMAGGTDKHHDIFEVTMVFNKDGSPVSGSYSDTRYTASNFDFTTMTPTGTGLVRKSLSFSYEYGDPKDCLQPFDDSPYFIATLNPTINNDKIEGQSTTNNLNPGDDPSQYVELNFAPSTALDAWQYKIRASSNTSVVDYDTSYNVWKTKKNGTSNITIDNGTTKTPSVSVTVNVVMTKEVRNFSMYLPWGYSGFGDDNERADQALVYQNDVKRYQINAYDYGGTGAMPIPDDVTFTFKDSSGTVVDAASIGLVVTIEDASRGNYSDIVFDATNLNIPQDGYQLKMTLHTSHYHAGQMETTFTVVLFQTNHTTADMFGTWVDSDDNATLVLSNTPDATNPTYYDGSLTVNGTTYTFNYYFRENTVDLEFAIKFDRSDVHASMRYCEMTINDPEAIQMAVWEDVTDTNGNPDIEDIIGFTYEDEGEAISTRVGTFLRSTI